MINKIPCSIRTQLYQCSMKFIISLDIIMLKVFSPILCITLTSSTLSIYSMPFLTKSQVHSLFFAMHITINTQNILFNMIIYIFTFQTCFFFLISPAFFIMNIIIFLWIFLSLQYYYSSCLFNFYILKNKKVLFENFLLTKKSNIL